MIRNPERPIKMHFRPAEESSSLPGSLFYKKSRIVSLRQVYFRMAKRRMGVRCSAGSSFRFGDSSGTDRSLVHSLRKFFLHDFILSRYKHFGRILKNLQIKMRNNSQNMIEYIGLHFFVCHPLLF